MLTSHCLHCGAPKDPANYAADYCAGCAAIRVETREFVTRENDERNKANMAILTPEVKARLEQAAQRDVTGSMVNTLVAELGIKPLIDMSQALREAMMRRAHHTNTGHTDPRAIFNPGTGDARMANLGMAAKVAANVNIERAR